MHDAARFFKVLSDATRLDILWLLFHHRELCVCDVMATLAVTQSKASRHLLTLKQAGLVSDRKDGLWSHYRLRVPEDGLARAHLGLLRSTLASRPQADGLLAAVEAWLASKRAAGTCASGACASPAGPTP